MGITREVLPQSESLYPYRGGDIITFVLQNAHLVPPSDGHDTTGEIDPSAHGFGPVEVSLAGFPSTGLDDRVIHTSQLIGGRFSYNQDLNAGNFVGIGVFLIIYHGTLIQPSFFQGIHSLQLVMGYGAVQQLHTWIRLSPLGPAQTSRS